MMLHVYSQYSRIVDFAQLPDPSAYWELGDLIGEGTYGEVYEGWNRLTGEKVAIKVMESVHEVIEEIEEEYIVLDQLSNHRNMPQFHGLYLKSEPDGEDQVWLVMELCEGGSVTDLSKYLHGDGRRMDEVVIAHILRETILVLKHLHDNKVMHRDVKGHNILLTLSGKIKLVDFGVSGHLATALDRKNTSVGTPYWMAPEVIACEQQLDYTYDLRCDIWSLGITAIELADSAPPLADVHPMRALFRIPRNPPPTVHQPNLWSPQFLAFITRCLKKDFEKRPFCEDLLKDPFISQVPDDTSQLQQMLSKLVNETPRRVHEPDVTTKRGCLKSRRKSRRDLAATSDDLALLENLNEDVIVTQLYTRYMNGAIYTYIGDILLAVNPFTHLSIYTKEFVSRYSNAAKADNPPHIYAVADLSYQAMLHQGLNQCIVISGESGAGKTESANFLVQQLTHLGQASSRILEDRILLVNPLVEAFGNAKTVINDNSSRFGKYLEMVFTSHGKILAATITEYLLEKSRVIYQSSGEQNFHVFYYIKDGITSTSLQTHLGLHKDTTFRYLNSYQRKSDLSSTSFNKVKFTAIQNCFDIIGFKNQDVNHVYSILAAILHLGNVEFSLTDGGTSGDCCSIHNHESLNIVSRLLAVDAKDLIEALTTSGIVTRGEIIIRQNSWEESVSARDGMAKAIYGRLFSWVVNRINALLKPHKSDQQCGTNLMIGLLDIFGFEHFRHNSFEQLCINIANEQIQFYFNQHIFAWEMLEYENEGVDGSHIDFIDNRPILDMFLSKPLGILALLDEESNFPKATDQTLVDKFHTNIRSNYYIRPKGDNLIFTIDHYAGKVDYDANGFLEKNRDRLPMEIVNLLRMSDMHIVRTLFHSPLTKTGNLASGSNSSSKTSSSHASEFSSPISSITLTSYIASSRSPSGSSNASVSRAQQTIAAYFRYSLMDLLAKMVSGSPHFVRCIKPNDNKEACVFNASRVTTQLRYTGVLETTRIRRQGYSHRVTFSDFIPRYYLLVYKWVNMPAISRVACKIMLNRLGLTNWRLGKSKVFLKYYHVEELSRRFEAYQTRVTIVQAFVRQFLATRRLARLRIRRQQAAVTIQKVYRGHLVSRVYRAMMERRCCAAVTIQSWFRGQSVRRGVVMLRLKEYRSAVTIQKYWRGHQARKLVKRMKESRRQIRAALLIQAYYRKYRGSQVLKKLKRLKSIRQADIMIQDKKLHSEGREFKRKSFQSKWMLPLQQLKYYNMMLHHRQEMPPTRKSSKQVMDDAQRSYYDAMAKLATHNGQNYTHDSDEAEDERSRSLLAQSAANAILANKPGKNSGRNDVPWDAPLETAKLQALNVTSNPPIMIPADLKTDRSCLKDDVTTQELIAKLEKEAARSYLSLWKFSSPPIVDDIEYYDNDNDDYHNDSSNYDGTDTDYSLVSMYHDYVFMRRNIEYLNINNDQ